VSPRRSECVLYVEDDADHAELVLRTLERSGKKSGVVHVEDGAAALDYLGRSQRAEVPRPCLILLDLRLPKIDGMDVLRKVKTSPELAAIPVVVLTTSASEQDVSRAYACNANSYLVKPDDFASLDTLVRELGKYWLELNRTPAAEQPVR
jgi:CheY-like chemotaxis protein